MLSLRQPPSALSLLRDGVSHRLSLRSRTTACFFIMGMVPCLLAFLPSVRDRPFGWPILLSFSIFVPFCAVASWACARSVLSPVRASAAMALRIAHGDLDGRVPRGGQDEVGALLTAIGEMREQIRVMLSREMAQRQSAQAMLTDALDSAQEGVVVVGPNGCVLHANSQAAHLFGIDRSALSPGAPVSVISTLVGRRSGWRLHPGSKQSVADVLSLSDRWLRVSQGPTRDGGSVVVCSDVTDVKTATSQVEFANARLDAAVSSMIQGICLFDATDTLQFVNPRFSVIYGIDPARVHPGMAAEDLLRLSVEAGNHPGLDPAALSAELAGSAASMSGGVHHRLAGGRIVAVVRRATEDGGWVVTFEDVTERFDAQDRLRHAEHHDGLTGLGNRTLLFDRLAGILAGAARPGPTTLLLVDIQGFKTVNEALGQFAGDQLLTAAAGRLLGMARDSDTIARVGGDHFAIVCAGVGDTAQVELLGRRFLSAFRQPFQVGTAMVPVSARIGAATFPADGTDGPALLKAAGMALDRAKLSGTDGMSFADSGADALVQQRRALEIDLHAALARDELDLHFQPLHDLKADRIGGFEALLRWRHPGRGMVSPADFIPIAERTGLIVPIGEWVLRRACAAASTWPEAIRVAVNVSPPQLLAGDLVRVVSDALAHAGLPASRLELEVTESVLLADTKPVLDVLHGLRGLGVRVAMDDFGTGYSSLSSLRSFPFDKIKVDQVFIRHLGGDTETIVRAIIGLGHGLNMRLTAEGVETVEQMAWLRREGCHEAQGYLISRPLPAKDVAAFLSSQAGKVAGAAEGAAMLPAAITA